MRRAAGVALVVGTCLTLLNHGEELWSGFEGMGWKIPLTFVIPFLVSLQAAIAARRGSRGPGEATAR